MAGRESYAHRANLSGKMPSNSAQIQMTLTHAASMDRWMAEGPRGDDIISIATPQGSVHPVQAPEGCHACHALHWQTQPVGLLAI